MLIVNVPGHVQVIHEEGNTSHQVVETEIARATLKHEGFCNRSLLNDPATLEPRPLENMEEGREFLPIVARRKIVSSCHACILSMHKGPFVTCSSPFLGRCEQLWHQIQSQLAVIFFSSKPNDDLLGLLVDLTHQANLLVSLIDVLLIYAYGIGPKGP